ncbi:MAG: enoyl-CoA hydratase/isomerase family protein [Rhodobiaceae bacterium]|nr:enoyl-CoA hydratase/isomerase family protein [Rhodobiaceae bacterium]MCC0041620.1 enoyl-CoA hydratase/isomerase family protein [Rhodobiaceae bacterium]
MSATIEHDEVLFAREGCAGIITLNRPKALNAVSSGIVRAMRAQLEAWKDDAGVRHVIIKAVPGRAFSAGGDVRQLYDWGKAHDPMALTFYGSEYQLNTCIKHYPKPYIALIDGIVMGGGVGVSVHGSHRVAGSSFLFAMPETGIGLFPDVGGTYFLPRLPGEMGTYLGLTGARIGAADALALGIATHAVPSERLAALESALTKTTDIDTCIANYASPPGEPKLAPMRVAIDRCFSGDSVEDIVARLQGDAQQPFGADTAAIIAAKSPTSLKITLRQLREGAKLDFRECMRLEYRIVNRVLENAEFFEGVRAIIIDKDNTPHWNPARLEDVDAAAIEAYFAPLGDKELDLP